MRHVSLREANQNFSSCIAEVEAGEALILMRRGRPVAQIIPASAKPDAKREAARKKLLAIMDQGLDLGGKPFTYEERHGR